MAWLRRGGRDALITRCILGSLLAWMGLYALLPYLVSATPPAPPPVLDPEVVVARQEAGHAAVALTHMPLNHRYREARFLAPLPLEYRCLREHGVSAEEIDRRLRHRYHFAKGLDAALEEAAERRAPLPDYDFRSEAHCTLLLQETSPDELPEPLPPPL